MLTAPACLQPVQATGISVDAKPHMFAHSLFLTSRAHIRYIYIGLHTLLSPAFAFPDIWRAISDATRKAEVKAAGSTAARS